MRSLKVTQENLDNQRNAVQEEKRLRYDNQPYVNAFLRMNELIFTNPANAHSTIGSMEDLDAATIDDVQEFFRIYYAPNNAVLTIVGDFDRRRSTRAGRKYFEEIPGQPTPPPVDVSEPEDVAQCQESLSRQACSRARVCARLEDSGATHAGFLCAVTRRPTSFRRRQFAPLSKAGEGRRVGRLD